MLLVFLLSAALWAQGHLDSLKPAVAVLDLTGNGYAKADLEVLTNRLRSELVETGHFTVVERSEMTAILKEQGFQQTGCTDASCAVEVGRLLNVQYMIIGSVDKAGEIITVNVRQVKVESGVIVKNIKHDCFRCSIETVVVGGLRNAARLLCGLDTIAVAPVVAKPTGNAVPVNGMTIGTLTLAVSPPTASVYVDDSLFGNGTMMITDLPAGEHRLRVAKDSFETFQKEVTIDFRSSTNEEVRLRWAPHTVIGAGAELIPNNLQFTDHITFTNTSSGAGNILRIPLLVRYQVLPNYYLKIGTNRLIRDFSVIVGLNALNSKIGSFSADSVPAFGIFESALSGEIMVEYVALPIRLKDYFTVGLGGRSGVCFKYCQITMDQQPVNGWSWAGSNPQDNHLGYWTQVRFGGPEALVTAGYKIVRLSGGYVANFGYNFPHSAEQNFGSQFTVENTFEVELCFKF